MRTFVLLGLLGVFVPAVVLAQELKSSSDFFEHGYANVAEPKRTKAPEVRDSWIAPRTQDTTPAAYATPRPNNSYNPNQRRPFSSRPLPQSRDNTFELGRVDQDDNGY